MRSTLLTFFRQFLFWILFFNFSRLIFLIFNNNILRAEKIPMSEISGVFYYSFKLDFATACYIMVIPFLLLVVGFVLKKKWLRFVNIGYAVVIIAGYALTVAGEIGIYPEWKTKLTYKVIKYLQHPAEIYNSAQTGTFFILLLLWIVLTAGAIFLYIRFFCPDFREKKLNPVFASLFTLITPGLLFIGLRGGIQEIPINQSESFYSRHNILNIVSVNNGFNLYISVFENLQNMGHNPFVFMPPGKAAAIMEQLYKPGPDSTANVLRYPRPNIVMIILESWSADLIESLGAEPGITPEFAQLEKQGILFDQFYSSGSRSEQAMASIYSGFPSHPISSITVQPDKIRDLPSLAGVLKGEGYYTAFYFGGQLIYGNIKSYIMFNGFDKIMEGKDFPSSFPRGKLGIHDGFTLTYMLKEISTMKQPFFSSIFTLSTHSPYDQPFEKPLKWGDNEREYINSAYYTDHSLGEFFRAAQKEPWYDKTLFLLVSDHSHNSYRNWHPQSKEYHRVPFMMVGNAILKEYQGTRISKIGNQHDVAATLLGQLKIPAGIFPYSKDLLNPGSGEFAYYTTEDGMGWITPQYYFTFEKTGNYYYPWSSQPLPDSVREQGLAYLQTVFTDYLNR